MVFEPDNKFTIAAIKNLSLSYTNPKISLMKTCYAFTVCCLVLTHLLQAQTTSRSFDFYFDSGNHHPNNMEVFQDSLQNWRMNADEISVLSVHGFADNVGKAANNYRLSEKRSLLVDSLLKVQKLNCNNTAISFLGEEQPRHTNETASGRAGNRRVHVDFSIKARNTKVISPPTPEVSKDKKFIPSQERDTVIVLPEGTRIVLRARCLDGVKLSDIRVEGKEFFTKDEMILNDMFTETSNGECLSTGGMLNLSITDPSGRPVRLKEGCDMTIQIPRLSQNTNYDLYELEKGSGGENLGWNKRPEAVNLVPDSNYFEVVLSQPMLSMNLDFLKVGSDRSRYERYFVKTRVISNGKAYVSGGESVLKLERFKPKKFDMQDCECIPPDEQFVTAFAEKDGTHYFCHKKRGELKRGILFRNKFIIRKKDYITSDSPYALQYELRKHLGKNKTLMTENQ
jgi:outer membrane protein OmpA-like peptidoglycan-associated protein